MELRYISGRSVSRYTILVCLLLPTGCGVRSEVAGIASDMRDYGSSVDARRMQITCVSELTEEQISEASLRMGVESGSQLRYLIELLVGDCVLHKLLDGQGEWDNMAERKQINTYEEYESRMDRLGGRLPTPPYRNSFQLDPRSGNLMITKETELNSEEAIRLARFLLAFYAGEGDINVW